MRCLLYCGDSVIVRCYHVALMSHLGTEFTFPGIYYDPKCSNKRLNHAVLVVGYGFEGEESDNEKYWIVKNRYKKPKIFVFGIEKEILFAISVWI